MRAWEVERKVDLANGLVLAVLVDNGEVPSGALGKFVEVLVGTGLHQRDAVDLHALRFRLGAKFTRPNVRAAGHAIGHKADNLWRGAHPKGHFNSLVPGSSRGERGFLDDASGIGQLLGRGIQPAGALPDPVRSPASPGFLPAVVFASGSFDSRIAALAVQVDLVPSLPRDAGEKDDSVACAVRQLADGLAEFSAHEVGSALRAHRAGEVDDVADTLSADGLTEEAGSSGPIPVTGSPSRPEVAIRPVVE